MGGPGWSGGESEVITNLQGNFIMKNTIDHGRRQILSSTRE